MREISVPFNGNTFLIKVGQGEKINILDLWKAAGSPKGKRPNNWLRTQATKEIISAICDMHNLDPSAVVTPVQKLGTFCHHAIASRYAQYLDPMLVPIIEESWRQRIQEEQDPELGLQRQVLRSAKSWERQGKSAPWIDMRIQGIMARNQFTSMLARHGVHGQGFKLCTDEINKAVVGGTAAQVRAARGLKKGANLRDNVSRVELAALQLAEALASEEIDSEIHYGNQDCARASARAGKQVRVSLELSKGKTLRAISTQVVSR
jgi:hypothetical protein